MKKLISSLCLILAAMLAFAMPVLANSAAPEWAFGPEVIGLVQTENCPIEVEEENLTFHIHQFPAEYYESQEVFDAYNATVTAEYTFHNPTDQTVTAKLLFPYGILPDYAADMEQDLSRYQVTVNGAPVKTQMRHSYDPEGGNFALDKSLQWLNFDFESINYDGMWEGDPITLDTPVAKRTYQVTDLSPGEEAFVACWHHANFSRTLLYIAGAEEYLDTEVGYGRGIVMNSADPVVELYIIGDESSYMEMKRGYSDGRKALTLEPVQTEVVTFREFLMQSYDPQTAVSEEDWQRAALARLEKSGFFRGLWRHGLNLDVRDELMGWLEYEITFAPGERLVNAVTVPIYPAEKDGVYGYEYLLSPAQTWASFGKLNITIDTPFYLYEPLGVYEKTDSGYTRTLDTLPEGELSFLLKTAYEPIDYEKYDEVHAEPYVGAPIGILIFVVIPMVMIPIAVISLRSNRNRK